MWGATLHKQPEIKGCWRFPYVTIQILWSLIPNHSVTLLQNPGPILLHPPVDKFSSNIPKEIQDPKQRVLQLPDLPHHHVGISLEQVFPFSQSLIISVLWVLCFFLLRELGYSFLLDFSGDSRSKSPKMKTGLQRGWYRAERKGMTWRK